ncbi:3'-5' exonuclease [Paracoccus sp. NGMCC 1.201697]|uniref:3'-5' exonuclease n=1 Tax=Paracoccus broussonetiae subsp. drimophilus TaxID=3373869 RepID=A0ABW7LLD5_9RHOB
MASGKPGAVHIHLMRHFGEEFGRTFRSIDQIAYAARTFVLRNSAQIDKRIVPAGTATEPAIRIVTVSKGEDEQRLFSVLAAMASTVEGRSQPASVLLLGRYRFSEPDMRGLKHHFLQLLISFKTIHASKGLEADHVILLSADSGSTGFPSEIVDDRLLTLVSPEEEVFQNAEERRVMYVAMTRARQTLTILASNARPSSFVTELREDPAYGIAAALGRPPLYLLLADNGDRPATSGTQVRGDSRGPNICVLEPVGRRELV